MKDYIYDIEVLPNVFTCTVMQVKSGKFKEFEISPRKNGIKKFVSWINKRRINNDRMVGFNNIHYDYPVIHHILTELRDYTGAKALTEAIYKKSKAIINDSNRGLKFAHTIWDNQHLVAQLDLFKIHHFDNPARSTSLKRLQFNMRLKSIQEFGIPFDEPVLRPSIIKRLMKYNRHDVSTTKSFMDFSLNQIKFREELTAEYGRDCMNHNDTKIGEDYLVSQIRDRIGEDVLYTIDEETGKRKKRGTPRKVIPIKDIIFDYIKFDTPEFQAVLDKLNGMKMFVINGKFHWNEHDKYHEFYAKLKEVKAALRFAKKELKKWEKDSVQWLKFKEDIDMMDHMMEKYADHHVICDIDGFTFEFGKGGLHGSRSKAVYISNKTHVIKDVDVAGFYPDLGFKNELYPEHLTKGFCTIYGELPKQRALHVKGTSGNKLFKLAGNGSYGKTNSKYSVLFDPKYMVATTINGQLMLAMLWEKLRTIDGIEIVQANTDGITFYIDRKQLKLASAICNQWQRDTMMVLEHVTYDKMFIRDVNNYMAVYMDGNIKTKGAYVYKTLYHDKGMNTDDVEWHKNHSMIIVQKAAEAELVHGIPASKFIMDHDNIYDFFLCTNVNRTDQLMIGEGVIPAIGKRTDDNYIPPELDPINEEIQRVSRYLVGTKGGLLTKKMKPKVGIYDAEGKYDRFTSINAGQRVTIHNDIESEDVNDYDINYQFYVDEANKLIEPFRR